MTEEGKMAFQASLSANVIRSISNLFGVSIPEATDMFYQSETSELIEEGVSDLQCRSPKYLATLVWEEFQETSNKR